jgi:WD40 repeat protein
VDRASGAFQFDWGGSPDLEIRNASTEAPVHTLSGHQLPSVGIRISADGRRAVSADESGVVIVWDLQSQTHTSLSSRRLSGDVNFAVSADFSTAVVGSSGNDLTIWDITTSTRKIPVPRSFSDGTQCYLVSCLALSGDGKVIAVGAGGIVYVWWIERDSPVRKIVLPNSAARAMSIAISPSGSWLAVGLNDSLGIELFHCDDLKHSKTLLGQAGTITSLVIGDNDRTLFSGSTDATIQAWDTDKPGDSPTNDLASVDDEINDASVMTWLCRHRVPVTCGSVTEDGTLFVTGDAAGVINVWDASTGMVQSQLLGHKQSVNALKVASDARLVLSGGGDSFAENDNSIRLWRLSDGMCVHTLHDHGTPVTAVDIKSDGTMFASGSRDGSVLVGNLVTARGLWLKYPHALSSTTPCVSIAATPNWRFLVAGWQSSHGGSVAMWDVESGKERWRADHVPDGVAEVGIAASGQLVVTRSRSGTVQVWDVDLNKCVNSATGDTGRIVWYAVMRPNEAVWAAQCFADHVAFYEAGRRTWSEVPAPAVALVFPGRFTFAIGTADGCFGMAFRPNGEHIHLRRTERCFYT